MSDAALTINFHPDRETRSGQSVLASVFADGRFKNQFETGITNGDPSAHTDGRRAVRESQIFGGHYDGADASRRPIHGALNVTNNPLGGWPRFGSSHVVLSPSLLPYCTYSIGNSLSPRAWIGTYDQLQGLIAELLAEPIPETSPQKHNEDIDGIIDVQIHRPVRINEEVVGFQLDPSFMDTETATTYVAGSTHCGADFAWGPKVQSFPAGWKVSPRRTEVARLLHGLPEGVAIDAEWIGRTLRSHDFAAHITTDQRDGIAKFLWNRTLLTREKSVVDLGTATASELQGSPGLDSLS